MTNRYSSIYVLWCQEMVNAFQDHLHRPLTGQEQRWCENIGSLMMLESVDRDVASLHGAAEVEHYLHDMADWTEDRFQHTLSVFFPRLISLIERDLTVTERQALEQQGTISRWYQFDAQLAHLPVEQHNQWIEHWLATWE